MTKISDEFGYCHYEFVNDETGKWVHIYDLYVYPEFRRQGKARDLLQLAIEDIRDNRWEGPIKIVAIPREDSITKEDLISFYERMGLEVYTYYGIE